MSSGMGLSVSVDGGIDMGVNVGGLRNEKNCIYLLAWGCLLYTSPSPRD